ncbi:unnamed protein product, partial [Symbiodinium microadriaticum]
AYGYYGHYGRGSTNFLPANISIQGNDFDYWSLLDRSESDWELRKTWLTTFQGEPKEPTGPIFDAIAGNTSGWISLIANSSDPDTRGLPFAVSETEDMALVSELLFRDQFPRDNATIVNALVVEFQQCQRRFYKEEQAGYNQRILDWLSQQPATAGLKYTVTTDISLVWTVA